MRPTSAPSATRTLTRTDARPQLDSYDEQSARAQRRPLAEHAPAAGKNRGTRMLVRASDSAVVDAARQPKGSAGAAVALQGTETEACTRTRTRLPSVVSVRVCVCVCVYVCVASMGAEHVIQRHGAQHASPRFVLLPDPGM